MGAYQALNDLLLEAPSLSGVDIKFGEETIWDQNRRYPRVTIIPTTGEFAGGVGKPVRSVDPNINMLWDLHEVLQIHCWAKSNKAVPTILDHYDECETLRQNVLQGFRQQRYHFVPDVGPGFDFEVKPFNTFWVLDDSRIKTGRALVIEMKMIITITDVVPTTARIGSINLSQRINH